MTVGWSIFWWASAASHTLSGGFIELRILLLVLTSRSMLFSQICTFSFVSLFQMEETSTRLYWSDIEKVRYIISPDPTWLTSSDVSKPPGEFLWVPEETKSYSQIPSTPHTLSPRDTKLYLYLPTFESPRDGSSLVCTKVWKNVWVACPHTQPPQLHSLG